LEGVCTEYSVLLVNIMHIVLTPFTKVEESFNTQAVHDILFHRFNFTEYDHHQFPGVVPRTFIGPLAISLPLFIFAPLLRWMNIRKYVLLIAGFAAVLNAFFNFARRIELVFGGLAGEFLRLIVMTQFHFMFYSSRPLPNIFALVGVLWTYNMLFDGRWLRAAQIATVFTLLFRCELILLFACIFAFPLLSGYLPLLGRRGVIPHCLFAAVLALAISIPIDSFFWRRWVWPEGEVWWFNVVMNKSHEYGVSPYFWYFYSAIPRALMASILLVPFGHLFDRKLSTLTVPVLGYVLLYSFLPHKELRFIIYVIPVLNVAAAVCCARLRGQPLRRCGHDLNTLASHLLIKPRCVATRLAPAIKHFCAKFDAVRSIEV
uniref:Mannosyltransferase n=1 Tax=Gongylonema pulchrum TaxID=637853 RepID=A0A183CUH0_9BILA